LIKLKCPVCGKEVNRTSSERRYLGFGFGSLMIFIFIIFLLATLKDFNAIYILSSILISIITISLFIIGYKAQLKVNVQIEKHLKYLEQLPKGIVPPEKRSGYGKVIDYGEKRVNLFFKNTPAENAFLNLNGDWNIPVLSYDVRKRLYKKEKKTFTVFAFLLLIIILIFIFLSIYFKDLGFAIFGLMLGPVCFLFFVSIIMSKSTYLTEPILSKAICKKRTIRYILKNIEKFLDQYGEKYHREIKEKKRGTQTNYKFVFNENNNAILIHHFSDKYNSFYSWIGIEYRSKEVNQSKDLQKKLDEFLVKRDLIYRNV
jgi:hypothetical protein